MEHSKTPVLRSRGRLLIGQQHRKAQKTKAFPSSLANLRKTKTAQLPHNCCWLYLDVLGLVEEIIHDELAGELGVRGVPDRLGTAELSAKKKKMRRRR